MRKVQDAKVEGNGCFYHLYDSSHNCVWKRTKYTTTENSEETDSSENLTDDDRYVVNVRFNLLINKKNIIVYL